MDTANTYVLFAAILYGAMGLIWDRSNATNGTLKTAMIALAVFGAYVLYVDKYVVFFIVPAGLLAGWLAILWKSTNLLNIALKLLWITVVVWGLIEIFENKLIG